MKKYIALIFVFIANISSVFADENPPQDLGLFGSESKCLPANAMREGNIHIENIPCMIQGAINFFLSIAGTVAVIFVIIGAYKILFGSLSQDKTKGKDTIIMALTGFALATLSWFIIKILLDNFS